MRKVLSQKRRHANAASESAQSRVSETAVAYGAFDKYGLAPEAEVFRLDVQAERSIHANATRLPVAKVVAYLQEVLGQRLTAVIAGTTDGRAVYDWAKGQRQPLPATEERLRNAFRVVQLLIRTESADTVRAWFIGMNPELDDQAPALAIAEEPLRVLRAARTFVVN